MKMPAYSEESLAKWYWMCFHHTKLSTY